jgi:hypothetical protein
MNYHTDNGILAIYKTPTCGAALSIALLAILATAETGRTNPAGMTIDVVSQGEISPQCKIKGTKPTGVLSAPPQAPTGATAGLTTKTQRGGSPVQLTIECNHDTSAKIANAQTLESITPALPSGASVQHSFGTADSPGTGDRTGAIPTMPIPAGDMPIYIHTEATMTKAIPAGKYTAIPMLSIP